MDIDLINKYNEKIGSYVKPLQLTGKELAGKSPNNFSEIRYYGYIYEIICDSNLKAYVGKHASWKIKKPCGVDLYFGSGGPYYKNAINKYGKEHFHKYILDVVIYDETKTEEDMIIELCEKEIEWIAKRNNCNKAFGYNLNKGGNGDWSYVSKQNIGRTFVSKEDEQHFIKPEEIDYYLSQGFTLGMNDNTKKLMSENSGMKGAHHTEESKKDISLNMIGKNVGKKRTEELKKWQSETRTGNVWVCNKELNEEHWVKPEDLSNYSELNGWVKGRFGVSDETKRKMIENRTGRVWVNNGIEQKFVTKDESIELLNKGYKLGRGSRTKLNK